YQAIISASLTEKLLSQFLELKGLRLRRLARLDYAFTMLASHHFAVTTLADLLADEVKEILATKDDLVTPRVLNVSSGDAFLAVSEDYAIVGSGRPRRYFPSVNEPLSDPARAA